MAISRARMCTNRLQNSIRLQRKEIAGFLREGREEGARLKGEHLLREYRLERAMEILVTSYLATERTCPPDLVSPIHTLLYCEPRLSIDELGTVRRQFAVKYGEMFVERAVKNAKQEVHFKLVHALSLAPPLEFDIQQLLCGIAKEYCISEWKPSIAMESNEACDFIPRPSLASKQTAAPFLSLPPFKEPQRHNHRQQQQQQQQQPQQPQQLQQREEAVMAGRKSGSKDRQALPSSVDADSNQTVPQADNILTAAASRRSNGGQDTRENSPNCNTEAHLQRKLVHAEEACGFPSLQPPPNPHAFAPDKADAEAVPLHSTEARFIPVHAKKREYAACGKPVKLQQHETVQQ
ncbi:hypothetical protein, conserved [Eimeria acervulina]|uniref:IST1-like protein n=1 Tax=Eimeria acervulina TaxID=5801 RepID=U6JRU2_EIMAC|nr:hypothetical protein, conserved [Eimeria acervulina]CDJ26802.1 hypothetical protein, conserved [Eimeria acervulina]